MQFDVACLACVVPVDDKFNLRIGAVLRCGRGTLACASGSDCALRQFDRVPRPFKRRAPARGADRRASLGPMSQGLVGRLRRPDKLAGSGLSLASLIRADILMVRLPSNVPDGGRRLVCCRRGRPALVFYKQLGRFSWGRLASTGQVEVWVACRGCQEAS